MKETAIEWLMKEWPRLESQIPPYIIEEAKEIEKQNIEKEKAKSYMEGMKNQFIENEFRKL